MNITPEMLTALLADIASAKDTLEEKIGELEDRIAELHNEHDELLKEEQGYRLTLARRFPDSAAAEEERTAEAAKDIEDSSDVDLVTMTRTAAVEHAVRMLSAGRNLASPADIEGYLSARGRSDSRDQIGAALAYLHKRGSVTRPARARWRSV